MKLINGLYLLMPSDYDCMAVLKSFCKRRKLLDAFEFTLNLHSDNWVTDKNIVCTLYDVVDKTTYSRIPNDKPEIYLAEKVYKKVECGHCHSVTHEESFAFNTKGFSIITNMTKQTEINQIKKQYDNAKYQLDKSILLMNEAISS